MTDAAAAFFDHLRQRNLRAQTIKQRRNAYRRLTAFTGKPLVETTAEDIVAWLDSRELTPQTRSRYLSVLASFFRWAVIEGHVATDPTLKVTRPKVPDTVPRPMPEQDLAAAIALAPERVRPWLLLASYAGLRACEIAQLRAEDLWWHQEPPLIYIREGKGGLSSTVPMSPLLADELRRTDLPHRGWLFPRRDGNPGPTPPHIVSQLSNEYLHSMGITHTLHSARHRYGTQLLRASGGNLRLTQRGMRHKSIASTVLYTALADSELASALDALPPLRL